MAGKSTPRKVDEPRAEERAKTQPPSLELFREAGTLTSRPIRTPERYVAALKVIGQVLRRPHEQDSSAGNALEVLSILVENYEEENVPDLGDVTTER